MFPDFKQSLIQSVRRSNSQLIVLLQSGLFLFLFLLRDAVLFALLLWFGYKIQGGIGLTLEIIAMLGFVYLFLKYNGALSLVLTDIAMGNVGSRSIAARSVKRGMRFFSNAFGSGVVLFLGQPLLACPCFLFLNNFIFSPYLYVYEDLGWKKGRARSRELAKGLGWFVLGRTLALLALGYFFIVVAIALFFLQSFVLAAVLMLVAAVYLGLVESNFIWEFYNQTMNMKMEHRIEAPNLKYKVLTSFSIVVVILFYVVYKQVLPYIF